MTLIGPNELAFIIAAFCNVKTPKDLKIEDKADCVDYMVNCCVALDGVIAQQSVDDCKHRWAEAEQERKREKNRTKPKL